MAGWASACPGSHAPHAGPAGHSPWAARCIQTHIDHGGYATNGVQYILDYGPKYVVCAACGKSIQEKKDGTARSHPPSRIGPVKEAARRERAAKKIEKQLKTLSSRVTDIRAELADMLETL